MVRPMKLEVLSRFRAGLNAGRFTLTEVSQATGIPLATLSDMKAEGWGTKAIERLGELEAALDRIDPPKRRRSAQSVTQ